MQYTSDTYHMWTLIGTCNAFAYTQNKSWLEPLWNGFQRGLAYSVAKIGAHGVMVVDKDGDWARQG